LTADPSATLADSAGESGEEEGEEDGEEDGEEEGEREDEEEGEDEDEQVQVAPRGLTRDAPRFSSLQEAEAFASTRALASVDTEM
jgi:hypothetical protein